MIRSAKNYTKTNKQTNKKWTNRILGQMVKAKLYRENHTKEHTHTHSQKEGKKKEIYMYIYIKFKKKEESSQINKQIYQR